jgi:chromosomal replication initiation ATPase DnaA
MRPASQYTLDLPLVPSYETADFVTAPSNEMAFRCVTQPESWPQPIAVLVGEEGVGKTHLAHILSTHSNARFITAEMLGAAPADALAEGASVLILDGLETVAARGQQAQAALAQLINHVRATGTPALLLTSRVAPARIAWALPDIASRLAAAWQLRIDAPEDAMLAALLHKAFADRQLRVGEDVIAYLVKRIERSGHAVRTTAAALDAAALTQARAITMALARQIMNPGQ